MSRHTPGPWTVGFNDGSGRCDGEDGAWILASGGVVVVRGGTDQGSRVGVRNNEDARLIASAPDLLLASRASVALGLFYEDRVAGRQALSDLGWDQSCDAGTWAREVARAAIAKAEGR